MALLAAVTTPHTRWNMNNRATSMRLVAFALSATGLLLVFEVIRPFRDLSADGPLALVSWGVGATLAASCFFRKRPAIAVGVLALLANVIPLLGALALWWVMKDSNFMWH